MNFQSGGYRLCRNMSIKSSFHYLEKGARAAEPSSALEAKRNRVFRKNSPLQQFRAAR